MARSSFGRVALWIWVGIVITFLIVPILLIVPASFNGGSSLALPSGHWSTRWYSAVFTNQDYIDAALTSIKISLAASSAALAIGVPAAIGLVRLKGVTSGVAGMLLLSPIVFPALVLGVAMLVMFTSFGIVRSTFGLILAQTVVVVPYVIRTVAASMETFPRNISDAASVLGARSFTVFAKLVLPHIMPGVIAGAIFALIVSFDEFTVSVFLVGPGVVTLPVQLFNSIQFSMNPSIAALSSGLVAVSIIGIVIMERILGVERLFGSPTNSGASVDR